jgi:hypothetical protein
MRPPARASLLAALLLVGCGSDGVIDLLPPRDAAAAAPESGTDAATIDAPTEAGDEIAPCMNGACPCGTSDCGGGVCADLLNDPSHCGACAKTCSHFQYCQAGRCACLPGFTLCGDGSCHDLTSDPSLCGSCFHPGCASGEKCENGVCGTGACGGGLTGCPVASNLTACVDLTRGLPYCGDCTTVCGPDQICVAGACRSYAPATPCTSCPCAADCARTEGSPATCCPGIAGGATPVCVHASACP